MYKRVFFTLLTMIVQMSASALLVSDHPLLLLVLMIQKWLKYSQCVLESLVSAALVHPVR